MIQTSCGLGSFSYIYIYIWGESFSVSFIYQAVTLRFWSLMISLIKLKTLPTLVSFVCNQFLSLRCPYFLFPVFPALINGARWAFVKLSVAELLKWQPQGPKMTTITFESQSKHMVTQRGMSCASPNIAPSVIWIFLLIMPPSFTFSHQMEKDGRGTIYLHLQYYFSVLDRLAKKKKKGLLASPGKKPSVCCWAF